MIWCRKGAHEFQSTLPSRGATYNLLLSIPYHFISIHAPLAGSDEPIWRRPGQPAKFQSTLPSRGATPPFSIASQAVKISIHAPLAGSDWGEIVQFPFCMNFNPRSPRGERQASTSRIREHFPFQSTLPSRGATCGHVCGPLHVAISIHAPLAGSDVLLRVLFSVVYYFNPRSPRGERQEPKPHQTNMEYFNPRSPRGERRTSTGLARITSDDFNPRSPRGERPLDCGSISVEAVFQSTLPSRGATASRPRNSKLILDFNPRSPRGERPFPK